MLQSSRFFAILLGVALATPAVVGCTASASFNAGGEAPKPRRPPAPRRPPRPTRSGTARRQRRPLRLPRQPPMPSRCSRKTSSRSRANRVRERVRGAQAGERSSDHAAQAVPRRDPARHETAHRGSHGQQRHACRQRDPLGQRALAVKAALVAKGVNKDRLIAVGFGQTKPIADNTTEDGKAKNRRTEFHVAELGGKKYLGLDPTVAVKSSSEKPLRSARRSRPAGACLAAARAAERARV